MYFFVSTPPQILTAAAKPASFVMSLNEKPATAEVFADFAFGTAPGFSRKVSPGSSEENGRTKPDRPMTFRNSRREGARNLLSKSRGSKEVPLIALSPAAAAAGGDPVGHSVLFRAGGTLRIAFPIRRVSPYDGAPPLTDNAPLRSWDRETKPAQDPGALLHTDVAGQECLLV